LHLNSISVGQLVVDATRPLGLPSPVAPTEYADATVAEVAQALEELQRTGGATPVSQEKRMPSGVDAWIRAFTVELVERPLPNRQPITDAGTWQIIAPSEYPLATPLQEAFARLERGGGVVVCLPPNPDERHLKLLLEGARAVLKKSTDGPGIDTLRYSTSESPLTTHHSPLTNRFVLVQHGGDGAAFARALHLEAPELTTCVVDVPLEHPKVTEWVVAEAMAAVEYSEAYYDASGRRREPVLRVLPMPEASDDLPLGPADVLLVTGGGKGITAECALSVARETGVRLALLGRAQPDADVELAANLKRMAASGIDFRYISADITDEKAVQSAVREVESTMGRVTAILHGAGTNIPQSLRTLDEAAFLKTVAPKVRGARNLLAAIDTAHLRLFITFSSIIARTGMQGEADYALANEWLTHLTERFQTEHPDCRCLAVEWSVWSGIGMGERLGRIDALVQQGITPITPDEGIRIFHRLLSQYGRKETPSLPVAVVVTGRFGEAPTLKMEKPDIPFLRFLEQPRVFYPGVELVVDAELSCGTDPYLEEHVFQGERLFPAVMGLEAMAQTAMALMETSEPPIFEDVQFTRPVVVPPDAPLTIRLGALVREPGQIEVVLRSEETAFQMDYFRATCRFNKLSIVNCQSSIINSEGWPPVLIDPRRELYGGLLFQGERFQRLRGYRRLMARECIAEVAPNNGTVWFSRYLPQTLILGDPAVRDATLHAIQVCVPHATLLPIGVERLVPNATPTSKPRFIYARERARAGDIFTYDVEVTDEDGQLLEQWAGLRLKMIAGTMKRDAWVEPLLGPYIERRVRELIPSSTVAVVMERSPDIDRPLRSDLAIQRALGQAVPVWRRPDGKPEVEGERAVSVAHAGELTLAVAGRGPIGCDVEPVVARPASVWRELLGPNRFSLAEVIAREAEEDEATAATRVWTGCECLKKAGASIDSPLVLHSTTKDGWVLLAAGQLVIATFVAPVRGTPEPLGLAVLVGTKSDGTIQPL